MCTEADPAASAYGPTFGYYFSPRSKSWVSAPLCYPRWGNLEASGAQVGKAGGTATVTAIPTDGSNSGTYAPQTNTITWTPGGAPVAGCGKADLSCTIRLPKATTEWQWLLVHVTMPRTFFIDSPGSNCAGQHICAGFATNAWSYVGVPPKSGDQTISGRVGELDCDAASCKRRGLAGVTVTATGGPGGAQSATTDSSGDYEIDVDKGTWRVRPALAGRRFTPSVEVVKVTGNVKGVNFDTCAEPKEQKDTSGAGNGPCKPLRVIVKPSRTTVPSGKRFFGDKEALPVGFVASSSGLLPWSCRSGCVGFKVSIEDPKTRRPVNARVFVTAELSGASVTKDAPKGVLCRSVDSYLQKHCDQALSIDLSQKRDLGFYYWVPGVIQPARVEIRVNVRAPGYKRVIKRETITITPNVAFRKTLRLNDYTAQQLLWYGSLSRGVAIGDWASYCKPMLDGISQVTVGASAGEKAALLWAAGKAKKLADLCGKIPMPDLVGRLGPVGPWKLWTTFRPRFGFEPNGLLGGTTISDRAIQVILSYSGFFDAFTQGMVQYLYDGLDPLDPDTSTPSPGSTIQLTVWEVSHRLPGGTVKDALYMKMAGVKRGRQTAPFEAYVEGGYWPLCWLNPRLSSAGFTLLLNSCKSAVIQEYID
ncbi:MAG: carboxypeptidase-like regulatory domain-containing protein [Actinomycetota bacterium]